MAAAAVAVLLTAGCSTPASMSEQDALEFTRRALAHAGLTGVEVDPEPRLERCATTETRAWRTASRLSTGGTVELCVEREGDRAVFVRDVGPGDAGPLLTDEQFRRLEAFRYDPAGDRRRDQVTGVGAFAGVLVVLVAALLVLQLRGSGLSLPWRRTRSRPS